MRELVYEMMAQRHDADKAETFSNTDMSTEGIATAVVADVGHSIHNNLSTLKGWFEGVKKKREHINEVADATIEWLIEEDRDNRNLKLDMGFFKTWMKSSEIFLYRYYYLLADPVYNEMVDNLKKGHISELEDFISHIVNNTNAAKTLNSADMKDRKSATRLLDSMRTIKDLIVLVSKYKARANIVFDLLEKRDRSINGFPLQLMLSGVNDLRATVKKIVNLAT